MHHTRVFGRRVPVPSSRPLRMTLGGSLVALGLLGFLPVLGFWMIPLGLTVLAVDVPVARRVRRRLDVAVTRRVRAWKRRGDAS
jgi:hypothetical protein